MYYNSAIINLSIFAKYVKLRHKKTMIRAMVFGKIRICLLHVLFEISIFSEFYHSPSHNNTMNNLRCLRAC